MTVDSGRLRVFNEVLTDVSTLAGWGVKGAIAAPLLDFIVGVGPPWPAQVPVLTSLLELAVIMVIFSCFSTSSKRTLRRLLIVSAVFCGLALLCYFYASSLLVHAAPDGSRIIAGLRLRPDVAVLFTPSFGPTEALRAGGWDPLEVWTRASITEARIALLSLWFSAFGGFVSILGLFALGQRQMRRRQSEPTA